MRQRAGQKANITILVLLLLLLDISISNKPAYADGWWSRITSIFRGQPRRRAPDEALGADKPGTGQGPCRAVEYPLQALVPSETYAIPGTSEASESPLEFRQIQTATIDSQPTLWFYMPYTRENLISSNGESKAKLVILDEFQRVISGPFEFAISINRPSIIQIKLPQPLRYPGWYNWYFIPVCDRQRPSRNPVVSGWIYLEPENSDLRLALNGVLRPGSESRIESRPGYEIYRDLGLWHEALSSFLENYNPSSLEQEALYNELFDFLNMNNIPEEQRQFNSECCNEWVESPEN